MHFETILALITDREAASAHRAGQLYAQISALTEVLTLLDGEVADFATTRSTLQTLAADEFTADYPTVTSSAYQQILGVLRTTPDGMRAKEICRALNIEPLPKRVEKRPRQAENTWSTGRSSPKTHPKSSPRPKRT